MSKLIIITADMHKIAEFCINIQYRQPGNVVEHVPVEFEVFMDGENYRAVPLQNFETSVLTNLPNELIFEIKDGKICNCKKGTEEIVEDIVSKLAEMDLVKITKKSPEESAVDTDSSQPLAHKKEAALIN